jgi:hypothetical protein
MSARRRPSPDQGHRWGRELQESGGGYQADGEHYESSPKVSSVPA